MGQALERAFLRHGPPRRLISDQEGVFANGVLAELLRQWNVKLRFRTVGKHGSIAVTERAILALKHEWLRRVPVLHGLGHLGQLLSDFAHYYDECRGHAALGRAVPAAMRGPS